MFGSRSKGEWPGLSTNSNEAVCSNSGFWWNDLHAGDTLGCLSPVGSTSLWRISAFLNSENIYIGFCTLPLGRWIQPLATWNYNNWSFRTCEHRKFKVIGYETWNSINWIFYVHIFTIQWHLKIKKSQCASIHPLPSLHSLTVILSTNFH